MLIVTCSGIRLGRKIEVIEENRCFCWWRWHRQEKLLWHTFNKFNFLHTQFGSVYLDTARHPSVNLALVQLARDNLPKPFETWTRARASQSPCSSPFSLLSILKFKCRQSHTLLPISLLFSHPNLFSVSSIWLIELTLTWTWGSSVNSIRGNSKIDYRYNHQTFDAGLSSNSPFVRLCCARSHPQAQVEVPRPGPIDSDCCAGLLTEWLRLQDIYICTPGFKSWTSHQSIRSLLRFLPLTSLTDLTQWLRL